MRLMIEAELDYRFAHPADVLLEMEAADLPDQRLVEDKLRVGTASRLTPVEGLEGIGRRTWTRGDGRFTARYEALVDVDREATDLASLKSVSLTDLPGEAIHYLWPSRYCHSPELEAFAHRQFGELDGGLRIAAMAEWIRDNLEYRPGCSDASTTADDTFQQRKGICRDFAHVMINFARSVDVPARMVSAYAWGLKPPDFHAVVEVFLEGAWHLVDPTGLAPVDGLVRIGVGRDATDVSFMTVFGGSAELNHQSVRVERLA
jgi:transglutaminase-like putative cysteine protease